MDQTFQNIKFEKNKNLLTPINKDGLIFLENLNDKLISNMSITEYEPFLKWLSKQMWNVETSINDSFSQIFTFVYSRGFDLMLARSLHEYYKAKFYN